MADVKPKKGSAKPPKSEDSGIGEPLFVAFIFALPLIASLWPLLLLFKENAVSSFIDIWRGMVRPIVMAFDAFTIAFIVFLILEIWPMQTRPHFTRKKKRESLHPLKDPAIAAHWREILARADAESKDNMRLAIIEADALTDGFLRDAGYEGEHMADRLSRLSPQGVHSLNALWNAHRLRNMLVHEPRASVSASDAHKALRAFEDFLKEMGAL